MNRSINVLMLALVLGLSASACKTAQTSSAQGLLNKNPVDLEPSVYRLAWADGIEQVIPPAGKDLPALATNLSGLWYCRSKACGKGQLGLTVGTVILSLQNAVTNRDGTVSFSFNSPNTYAYDPSSPGRTALTDLTPVPTTGAFDTGSYRLQLGSKTHGDIIWYFSDPNSVADRTKGGALDKQNWFTFDYVEDGHWLRQSMTEGVLQPDYDMLRIVDQGGQRTDNYATYLADLKAKASLAQNQGSELARKILVIVPTASEFGKGGPMPAEGGRLPKSVDDQAVPASSRDSRDAGSAGSATDDANASGDHAADDGKGKGK